MNTLLWSLDEACRQLGGISITTIRRMIDDGQIDGVKVRNLLKVKAESVQSFINSSEYNPTGKVKKCHIEKKVVPIGGFRSVQAKQELDALLGR